MLSHHIRDGVSVLTIDNAPVNALSAAVRQSLKDALADAALDDGVRAIVITGSGRCFSGGADISEFGKAPQEPSLPEVISLANASTKPVVAAIHGTAFGGGLEVALGAHYRIAASDARLGLPEVKLGLLPGAGGTQRLPRLVGVEPALSMIVTGEPVTAEKALALGLIDRLAPSTDALVDAAVAFASEIADGDVPSHADRIGDTTAAMEAITAFEERTRRRLGALDAPRACIKAIRAAVDTPLAQGLAIERELFLSLVGGEQSRALRHSFFAQRAAARIDGIAADTPLIEINSVGILGGGTMGGGIAMNFLSAGLPVTLVEREQAALDRGVAIIRKNYERSASKGRLSQTQVEAAMSLLNPSLLYEDLAGCDLVIEAVYEEMSVKKAVFERLDGIVKDGAILATNTSYLDVNEIASATRRPDYVVGLHFFSPANVMKLLEIVRGDATRDDVLATSMALARKIGKIAVVAGVCFGFIGNRMLKPRQEQANRLVLEGATPADVDQVLLDFGMPMGPFQMADLAGLDLGWNRETSRSSTVREILCERDRRGQKTGRGFYDYDADRNRTSSEEVHEIIAAFAADQGIVQRRITQDEIRERLLYPMINEGAKILEEGKAQRASDIDVVWLNGYGWPAHTGGPMFWAEAIGLDIVVAGLERHAASLGDGFAVSPLLIRKARSGERFDV